MSIFEGLSIQFQFVSAGVEKRSEFHIQPSAVTAHRDREEAAKEMIFEPKSDGI